MNKKIILLSVSKKNENDFTAKHSSNHLFITISGKQFDEEKEIDILGLLIAGHVQDDSSENIPQKIQDLLEQYPSIKDEPSKFLPYGTYNTILISCQEPPCLIFLIIE